MNRMKKARRVTVRGAAMLIAGLLMACAPTIRDPWGLAVSRGETLPARAEPPATLQADLGVRTSEPGLQTVSSRLYARPGQNYRLDLFGFLTPVAASWFWEPDQWILVRHDTRQIVVGTGTALSLRGVPLTIPDIHAVLGSLWGNPLPGYPGDGAHIDSGYVTWTSEGMVWRARIDPVTGLCQEAASETMSLRYARHTVRDGLVVPGEIEVSSYGEPVLTLEVRNWERDPVWKKDPFVQRLPDDYDTVSTHR